MGNVILTAVMAGVLTTNACADCQLGWRVAPVRTVARAVVVAPLRVVAVPVRVVARVAVAPVRVLARVQPVRRLVRGVVRAQPVRRLLRRRPVRRLLFGRRLLGRRCCY